MNTRHSLTKPVTALVVAAVFGVVATHAQAWDHPAHMTTAAVAFIEIEQSRPELIEKLELVFMKHPDSSPFMVAAGDDRGTERAKRMFIEGARWADDTKGTIHDRPTWHTARWPIVASKLAVLTRKCPPGRSTRTTSASAGPVSGIVQRVKVKTTVSTLLSASGICSPMALRRCSLTAAERAEAVALSSISTAGSIPRTAVTAVES